MAVPIPIGNAFCLTQRFSPTGFNPNASDLRCHHPIALRLAFELKPIRSVQSYIGINFFLLEKSRFYGAANSTFLGGSVRVK
jgi:hypothetical protein